MKVTVDGHLYTIGWYYESKFISKLCSRKNISSEEIKGLRKKQICEKLGLKAFPLPDRTHCIITNTVTGEEFKASVRRDSRDPWNREEARIRSLEKVIWNIYPEHENKSQSAYRRLFWDKYHKRRTNDPEANIKKCIRHGIFSLSDIREFIGERQQMAFQIH